MVQSPDSQNVVSMFSRIKETKQEGENGAELSFTEIMKKNQEAADKMRKERNKQNRAVLRSYRIK